MTQSDVQIRLAMSLDQKIDHFVGVVDTFINRMGNAAYVSFSGGKDSSVMLYLVRRFFGSEIPAVFMNTGLEYPEIVRFVRSHENVVEIRPAMSFRDVIERYGFPLVSKEVSHRVSQLRHTRSEKLRDLILHGRINDRGTIVGKVPAKWVWLANARFEISSTCCDILKKKPAKVYERQTGRRPIIGTMVGESTLRMQQYLMRGGCISYFRGREAAYPLSIFTEKDIWECIRRFDIPICSLYQNPLCKRTGCMICGYGCQYREDTRLRLLWETHRGAYRALLKYQNNGVSMRQALHAVGAVLPDEMLQF